MYIDGPVESRWHAHETGRKEPGDSFFPHPLANTLRSLRKHAQHGLAVYKEETVKSFVHLPQNARELFTDRPKNFRYRVFEAAVIAATTAATVMAVAGRIPH